MKRYIVSINLMKTCEMFLENIWRLPKFIIERKYHMAFQQLNVLISLMINIMMKTIFIIKKDTTKLWKASKKKKIIIRTV